MKRTFVLLALGLGACAAQKAAYLPDGSKGFSINCSGPYLNWGACEQKAGQICGERGYDVVSKQGDQNAQATAAGGVFVAGANVQRTFLIRCKSPSK